MNGACTALQCRASSSQGTQQNSRLIKRLSANRHVYMVVGTDAYQLNRKPLEEYQERECRILVPAVNKDGLETPQL
jgi:hypothetical protein